MRSVAGTTRLVIPRSKLTHYLLDTAHPSGGSKARFFIAQGFSTERVGDLADALRDHALSPRAELRVSQDDRFVIEGPMPTPAGRIVSVRAIWRKSAEADTALFVTAYPTRARRL